MLPSRVLDLLRDTEPGAGGEIQLTDAINALLDEMPVQACSMEGITCDCGNKLGFLIANMRFGLSHEEIGAGLRAWLREQSLQ